MSKGFSGRWKNSGLIQPWARQTVSLFGSQITLPGIAELSSNKEKSYVQQN